MTLKYESELLFDLMKRDGDVTPSDVLPYESELKEKYLNQVTGAYPKLQDYRPEWLNYNLYHHLPSDFPVESVANVTSASFNNVVPYAYKSAILKGQTYNNICIDSYLKKDVSNSTSSKAKYELTMIDKSKNYDIYFDVNDSVNNDVIINITIQNWNVGLNVKNTNGRKKLTITSDLIGSDFDGIAFYFLSTDYSKGARASVSNIVVVESNNYDLPYFTGMQSVKMPVLKTVGKNLFDGKLSKTNGIYGVYSINDGTHTYSLTDNDTTVDLSGISLGDWDGKTSDTIVWATMDNDIYVTKRTIVNRHLVFYPNNEETFNKIKQRFSIQIEGGTVATAYEPYQSNISTVNEPVELRGIGEVKDELNLMTGEMTERIGEVVLDGTQSVVIPTDYGFGTNYPDSIYSVFRISHGQANGITDVNDPKALMSDCLKSVEWTNHQNIPQEGISNYHRTSFTISVLKSRLEEDSISGFKQWLQSNPITVQYRLETESVKTVDLTVTDHDGKSESTIRPIEGTMHVSTSSQTLPPLLDMSVPVEATSQNLMSFANIIEEE